MFCRHGYEREAKGMEFAAKPVCKLGAVHFVDDAQDRHIELAQVVGKIGVRGQEPVLAVNHKGYDAGRGSGSVDLLQYFSLKAAYAFRPLLHDGFFIQGDAACVDNAVHGLVFAADNTFQTISCHTRPVVGNGTVGMYKSVEQGGFADIGTSYQDDLGKTVGHSVLLVKRRGE